jgi:hypothetical protein
MNGGRRLVPELAIGLALCLGVHFMLVDPVKQRLGETRTKVSQLLREAQEVTALGADLPKVVASLEDSSRRAGKIHELSAPAKDEVSMFEAITSLAMAHRVSLDQLEPRVPTEPATNQAASSPVSGAEGAAALPPVEPPKPRAGDRGFAYSMTATAEFADMTAFVDALQQRLGYTIVRSLRVEPTYETGVTTVTATIHTEHFGFDATPMVPATTAAGAPQGGSSP